MCNAIPILLATLVLYTFILCAFCSSIDCELVFIRSDWLFFIPSHSLTLFTDIEINFVLCSRYLSFCLSVHHLMRHQNKNDDESIKFATSKILFRCLSYFVIDWLRFFFSSLLNFMKTHQWRLIADDVIWKKKTIEMIFFVCVLLSLAA